MGLKMMEIPEMERALEVLVQVPSYESGHRLKRNKGNSKGAIVLEVGLKLANTPSIKATWFYSKPIFTLAEIPRASKVYTLHCFIFLGVVNFST